MLSGSGGHNFLTVRSPWSACRVHKPGSKGHEANNMLIDLATLTVKVHARELPLTGARKAHRASVGVIAASD